MLTRLAAQRWIEIRDDFMGGSVGTDPAKRYNARALCQMLGLVHEELSKCRRPMTRYLGAVLVGWQIRPATPYENLDPDRILTAVADPDVPEVQI